MSETTWRAEVVRLNPATDVLIVKVRGRISAQAAQDIRHRVAAILPEIRNLIADDDVDFVVIRKTRRKTLHMVGRRR